MTEYAHDLIELAQQAQRSDEPRRELSELLLGFKRLENLTVHTKSVERMLAALSGLFQQQTWASEMQLGAEGFDNTASANAYNEVQNCLRLAARNIARACEVLIVQDW